MAEEVHIPRSGLWNLHSKKDRRWNLQGQYSSMEWGPSPTTLPVEARQALEELTASLGEDPPDDVRFIFRPYPPPRLRRLFDANAFLATETGALVLTQERGPAQLYMDLARELSFSAGDKNPPTTFQLNSSVWDQEHTYWQWGWVSAEKGSMAPLVLKSAQEIRKAGSSGKSQLTYAECRAW
jgi:hypothetical protein